jgi:hypothetical protein
MQDKGYVKQQNQIKIYRTSWTFPVAIRNVCKRWIEAERVVSRWTGITTQQFTTIFTNPETQRGKKIKEFVFSLIFVLIQWFPTCVEITLVIAENTQTK